MPENSKMSKELITPEKACALLERNTDNRKLGEAHVAVLVEIMLSGSWCLGPDPIVIDTNGRIVNGQHRLWAVVLSGTTQPFWVLREAETSIRVFIDRQKPRSLVDNHQHVSNGNRHFGNTEVAVVRGFYELPRPDPLMWTDQLMLQGIEKTRDLQQTIRNEVHYQHRIGSTVVVAVLMRAWQHVGEDLLPFIRALCERGGVSATDPAVNGSRLRDFLLSNTTPSSGRAARCMIYKKAQCAIHAFCLGTILKKLVSHGEDEFPVIPALQLEGLKNYNQAKSEAAKKIRVWFAEHGMPNLLSQRRKEG